MKKIAVFDFDGTLTTSDTLIEFIKFACGKWNCYAVFLRYVPLLVLMKLSLYPNWKLKQKIFSTFFAGMSYTEFKSLGEKFAMKVALIQNEKIMPKLEKHLKDGDDVYVISASIEEWVRPFCKSRGVNNILGTQIEIDAEKKLTGRFLTKNCYGQEKVNRLVEIERDRNSYILYAYGDSRGDKEILEYADFGYNVKNGRKYVKNS